MAPPLGVKGDGFEEAGGKMLHFDVMDGNYVPMLTVGPPFFNRWMAPLGLILLALTGIAPLLAWRRRRRRG